MVSGRFRTTAHLGHAIAALPEKRVTRGTLTSIEDLLGVSNGTLERELEISPKGNLYYIQHKHMANGDFPYTQRMVDFHRDVYDLPPQTTMFLVRYAFSPRHDDFKTYEHWNMDLEVVRGMSVMNATYHPNMRQEDIAEEMEKELRRIPHVPCVVISEYFHERHAVKAMVERNGLELTQLIRRHDATWPVVHGCPRDVYTF
jgi:hypothetical protein